MKNNKTDPIPIMDYRQYRRDWCMVVGPAIFSKSISYRNRALTRAGEIVVFIAMYLVITDFALQISSAVEI